MFTPEIPKDTNQTLTTADTMQTNSQLHSPAWTHRNPVWNMDILDPPLGPYLGVLSKKSFLMDT